MRVLRCDQSPEFPDARDRRSLGGLVAEWILNFEADRGKL
jgi:hypothetical protein